MTETLVVKSALRKYANGKNFNVSSEVVNNTINQVLSDLLDRAMQRAKENGRKTIKPCDL